MRSEGIILNKIFYKENHLVCKVLGRDGAKKSILVYGGRGGGKKSKPSIIEVGNLVEFVSERQKRGNLIGVKEWACPWRHERLKQQFRAVFLLNFFAELIDKTTPEAEEEISNHDVSCFNLLSNAVFYLEKSVQENQFEFKQHLALFLGKIIFYNGVYPELKHCQYCGVTLEKRLSPELSFTEGGFICSTCQDKGQDFLSNPLLWEYFSTIKKMSYKDYQLVPIYSQNDLKQVLSFFLSQFEISTSEIKSYSFIFQ